MQDKNGEEITKIISSRFQFIDSAKFMASYLSNVVNNVSAGIHKINANTNTMMKDLKLVKLNINIAAVLLNPRTLKMV